MPDTTPSAPSFPQRKIRSFVRREGRATLGQKQAMEVLWPKFGFETPDADASTLDFKALFGRDAPCVLEIGFGDGEALVDAAMQLPEQNFIGAEVYTPGVGHCLIRIEHESLENVRLSQEDAVVLLSEHIVDASLAEIKLFFPDPWHKKKHNKRRIVNAEFCALICKKLITGGRIHFATDWEPYAHWSLEIFETCDTLENISGKGEFTPKPDARLVTKFERRGQRLGHGSWDLIFTNTFKHS
ncbi:MAG: tRNA (guanosine(46)-N7)-methyltransferase TrmB [Arenicellales bacterium]